MADTPLRDRVLQTAGGTEPAFVPFAGTYASMRGVSRQTGKNWNDAGLIVWVPDDANPGKQLVDVAATDARRAGEQNPLKRATAAPVHAPSSKEPTPQPVEPGDLFTESPARRSPLQRAAETGGSAGTADAPAGAPPEYQDAQQRRASELTEEGKAIANELNRLKLLKLKGELVDREARQAAEIARARRIRDRLRQLPIALAEEVNPADPARAQKVLRREIDNLLNAIADDLAHAAREAAGDDLDDDDALEPAAAAQEPETTHA